MVTRGTLVQVPCDEKLENGSKQRSWDAFLGSSSRAQLQVRGLRSPQLKHIPGPERFAGIISGGRPSMSRQFGGNWYKAYVLEVLCVPRKRHDSHNLGMTGSMLAVGGLQG